MRRIAIRRTVGLLIAVTGIAGSVYYGVGSYRLHNDFYQWIDDRPMDCVVDLSKTGSITVPFLQTCEVSHGEVLFIHLEPGIDSDDEVDELFTGLSATIVISDSDGKKVKDVKIDRSTLWRFDGAEDFLLARFRPFERGEYVAILRVDSGATKLANHEQLIYAKYELCGLEHLAVVFLGAFSVGAGLIGLVASAFVVPGVVRHGVLRASQTETACPIAQPGLKTKPEGCRHRTS